MFEFHLKVVLECGWFERKSKVGRNEYEVRFLYGIYKMKEVKGLSRGNSSLYVLKKNRT